MLESEKKIKIYIRVIIFYYYKNCFDIMLLWKYKSCLYVKVGWIIKILFIY